MAITYTDNGGGAPNGSDLEFTFTFPVIQTEDVKVALNGVTQATTKYTVNTSTNPTQIEFNNTSIDSNVQANTGAPLSGVRVRVYRETTVGKATGDDDPKAVFAAGSSIRATDLNANTEQALYAIHELQNRPIETEDIQNSAVTSDKIEDGTIVNADVNASAAIAGTKISPDFGSQNITTTGTVNGVSTTELAILDGATVSTAELNILDGVTITTAELNALDGFTGNSSELNTLDGVTASTAELNKLDGATVTTAEINILDGVTATTSEINKLDGVTASTAELNILDGVTASTTELNALDGFTGTTANLNTIGGITASTAELNLLDGVTATTSELNLNDGQTATPAEVNILDGATLNTNELNKLDGVTASTAELNLLAGKSIVTSIASNATDVQIPSAQAVNERVVELVNEVGGFHPIANETSFPATNPDINDGAGTIVSLKALSSQFSTGSGVTTHTFTNGAGTGNNVTINGLPASTTFPAGRGLLLETTSTLHTYNYHRLTLDEAGVANAQAVVDDFDERYYGPFSANQATRPSGANRVNGDLYFNTSDGKMKVFNGSHASGTWDDVAAPGNFFINTLSSSSGSGGGSATFNGTATRFTLSNPPTAAAQLLVSVNGVIQKPNSGTSPSEGFVIDGSDIIFAAAPNTGATFFIVTIGSSVNIGTPSDNTVTSAKIVDGSIVNGDISSSAAIALSKLSTSGTPNNTNFLRGDGAWTTVNTDLVSDSSPQLGGDLDTNSHNISLDDNHRVNFGDSSDLHLIHNGTDSFIQNTTGDLYINSTSGTSDDIIIKATNNIFIMPQNGEYGVSALGGGAVELYYDNSKKFSTKSFGADIYGQLQIQGQCTPSANNTYDLGTTSERWRDVYVDNSIDLLDNGKLKLGNSDDLQIYHDGNHSYVAHVGTGVLRVRGDLVAITDIAGGGGGDNMAIFNSGGSAELYYDNSKKFETHSTGSSLRGTQSFCEGHFVPWANNTWDLGTSSYRWRNVYTNDLHLSNEGSSNDVDQTWGDWTIQEGESDLFLKNNRSGKKYKFNLTEVS